MNENKKRKGISLCEAKAGATPCCKVEGLVPIDARGQIVLPKDVREKAGIEPGDKLAVIAFESEGKICCIALVKAETFAESVKGTLGPVMAEILQEQE
jgi:antitoxin PrlF